MDAIQCLDLFVYVEVSVFDCITSTTKLMDYQHESLPRYISLTWTAGSPFRMASHREALMHLDLKLDAAIQLYRRGIWTPACKVRAVGFPKNCAPAVLICKRPGTRVMTDFDTYLVA